jgi:16S rRNA processing protein RimM
MQSQKNKSFIQIGKVGKAHGLRGFFFIRGRSEPLPESYEEIILGDQPERGMNCKILEIKMLNSESIVRCNKFESREAVQPFVDKPIWVRRDQIEEVAGEFIWDDLVGKHVIDIDGVEMGVVLGVYNHGASDLIEIANADGRKVSIAFIDRYFETNVDAKTPVLKLCVKGDMFSEFWN